jgi:hypothetical protein
MKIIVAGSRDFNNRTLLFNKLDEILDRYNISEIISGTAKGADTLGEQYAEENSLKCTEFPAEWNLYGKGAGHKRNLLMGEYADYAIVFWDGKSKGTKNMINTMKKLKKPVIVINYNEPDEFDEF